MIRWWGNCVLPVLAAEMSGINMAGQATAEAACSRNVPNLATVCAQLQTLMLKAAALC